MIQIAIGIFLGLFSAGILGLRRAYRAIPRYELKRRASQDDELAKGLFHVAVYGASAWVALDFLALTSLAASGVVLANSLPLPLAVLAMLVTLGIVALTASYLKITDGMLRFAASLAPAVVHLAELFRPVIGFLRSTTNHRLPQDSSQQIYEKSDLREVLANQKTVAQNRIAHDDLDLAARALDFADKLAADVTLPIAQQCLIGVHEDVGPLLLDRLHKSGQKWFLVYKDAAENIIGGMAIRDALNASQGGKVLDLVNPDLVFVHEEFSLPQVLSALHKTSRQQAVVINSFEENVGTISLENLLGELTSAIDAPEVDYENRAAIANLGMADRQQPAAEPLVAEQASL